MTGSEADLKKWLTKAQPVVNAISFAPCTFNYVYYQACEPVVPQPASP